MIVFLWASLGMLVLWFFSTDWFRALMASILEAISKAELGDD